MAKKLPISPLVKQKQFLFLTEQLEVFNVLDYKGYAFINYEEPGAKTNVPKLSTRFLGKESGDILNCIFFTKEELIPFERVKQSLQKETHGIDRLGLGHQVNTLKHINFDEINEEDIVIKDTGLYHTQSKDVLARYFDLPVLGMKIFNSLCGIQSTFHDLLDEREHFTVVDFTDTLYDINDGVYKPKKELDIPSTKFFKKKFTYNNKEYVLKFIPGVDFANKAIIKSIATYYKSISVACVIRNIDDGACDCYTVFTGIPKKKETTDYAVFRNGYNFRKILLSR